VSWERLGRFGREKLDNCFFRAMSAEVEQYDVRFPFRRSIEYQDVFETELEIDELAVLQTTLSFQHPTDL